MTTSLFRSFSGSSDESACLLALSHLPKIGAGTVRPLLELMGSARALWSCPESFLRENLKPERCETWLQGRKFLEPEALWARYVESPLGIRVLTLGQAGYPPLLAETADAPLVLYVRGNLDALTGRMLAIVGTRDISEYGRQVTDYLVDGLVGTGVCVVSGLALGVDAQAHWAALRNQLPTVAVLGSGIDRFEPRANDRLAHEILAAGGAVVSEYPLGIAPTRFTFPQRNRIVAGLSHGVVLVEGDFKSGARITARLALEENRSVYAVPGNIFNTGSRGPNLLLQQGAVPVVDARDILRDQGWISPNERLEDGVALSFFPVVEQSPVRTEHLTADEQKILALIPFDAVAVETVQQKTGLNSSQLSEHLTMLELEGLISALPGARVARCR